MARPGNFQTIYLDSCVFIAAIKNEAGCEPIKHVLGLADRQRIQVYGSPLALVEARGQGKGTQKPELERQALKIVDSAHILQVEFTRRVALRARDYVGTYGLRPLDAIHLASAVTAEVEVLWSLDRDFEKLWGTRVDGVWVDKPYDFGEQPIPGL